MSNLATKEENTVLSPMELVNALSPGDKATIMALCLPKGATNSDLALYLYRCRKLGFDPFTGDLVMQKRILKDGSVRITFITTRDALLKNAEKNLYYDGINSGVVRDGDTFLVDTEKGIIRHQFGSKRGAKLAGWAVVHHKNRKPVIYTADYKEYYLANAKSPAWESYPSAMIQKVAEVGALKRQFPALSGLYTTEEMLLEEGTPEPGIGTGMTNQPETQDDVIDVSVISEGTPPTEEDDKLEQPEENKAAGDTQSLQPNKTKEISGETIRNYTLKEIQTGKSSQGTPIVKVLAEKNGQNVLLIAKGEEGLAEATKLKEAKFFDADTYEEHGFTFIKTIVTDIDKPVSQPMDKTEPQSDETQTSYQLVKLEPMKGASGIPAIKIIATKDEKEVVLLARGEEKVAELKTLLENAEAFTVTEVSDDNGFKFVEKVAV